MSADLIMLGLATHEPNFTIIREEFKPNKPRPCALCGQMGHEIKDCQGTAREKQGQVSWAGAGAGAGLNISPTLILVLSLFWRRILINRAHSLHSQDLLDLTDLRSEQKLLAFLEQSESEL